MTQLGDTLSDERRRQGKSIVDVEAATRIRGRLLESLEHGDYDQLPAPAYVKGYIQSYAKYLDIPVQPLLEMYKVDVRFADERERERESRPIMPRGASYSKVSRQDLSDMPADPVVPRRDQQHAIPARTWMIAGGAILVVFLVIWGVSKLVTASSPPPPVPTSVQETMTPDAAATESAAVTPVEGTDGQTPTATSAESTEGITPFTLSFRIRPGQRSNLKVTIDGVTVYNRIVTTTGEIPSWPVYRDAKIVIGAPRYVTTFKNGARIPTPNQDAAYPLVLNNEGAAQ